MTIEISQKKNDRIFQKKKNQLNKTEDTIIYTKPVAMATKKFPQKLLQK